MGSEGWAVTRKRSMSVAADRDQSILTSGISSTCCPPAEPISAVPFPGLGWASTVVVHHADVGKWGEASDAFLRQRSPSIITSNFKAAVSMLEMTVWRH